MAKTFKFYNCGPFWLAGTLLEGGAPDFGPNPTALLIQPCFHKVRDPIGIPEYLDKYNKLLSKLPNQETFIAP